MSKSMSPVSKDSPLWLAWASYITTEEYANTKRWAVHPDNAEGSLWAAFERGFAARGESPNMTNPPTETPQQIRERRKKDSPDDYPHAAAELAEFRAFRPTPASKDELAAARSELTAYCELVRAHPSTMRLMDVAVSGATHVVLAALDKAEGERDEANAKLNSPELHDFASGVVLEAAHQRKRWGVEHDAGKEPADWFWVVGYLAGKALASHVAGNTEKALHHTISTAAVLNNWHAAIMGASNTMRPGLSAERHEAIDARTQSPASTTTDSEIGKDG